MHVPISHIIILHGKCIIRKIRCIICFACISVVVTIYFILFTFLYTNMHFCKQRLPVISYRGHFVLTLVISYLHFGHFVPSNNHFVPRSFRTHFGRFVPRSAGYEMTLWWSIRTQVISYPFWPFRTHFGHFVPSKDR